MLTRSAYSVPESVAIAPLFIEIALTVIWAGCMGVAAYGVLALLG
ncbi:MAG TPA: hypothetical protein VGJ20_25430 [Xanthobacteraceae bacterium]|jgi:hypothetical protein